MSRKFIKASPISAPSMRIIEDVYRRDLVVHFRVHVRVIVKALMKFDTRYIARGHLFAVFDCLLSSVFKAGGLSITSVNMLQALPIVVTALPNAFASNLSAALCVSLPSVLSVNRKIS